MDIFAHGLWTGVAYTAVKRKSKQPIKLWLAVLWGIIPDLFAFTLPFAFILVSLIIGISDFADFRLHTKIEPVAHKFPLYELASYLYNISHSVFVFTAAFILVALLRKNVVWEMCGWLLHILVDIPTHSYQFFPTPFLWPISDFRVNGFTWSNPEFMFANYALIALSFTILFIKRKNPSNLNIH